MLVEGSPQAIENELVDISVLRSAEPGACWKHPLLRPASMNSVCEWPIAAACQTSDR
jgi:hypothetical protein